MLTNASIMVTGGTGSFGQAFIEHALTQNPRRLVVYSRGEMLQEQMERKFSHPSLRFFIGDVRDETRLKLALRDIDYVIHAAALKVVPTCEYNPTEAVQTNVNGAMNVVHAALAMGVKKVVALSTDKACQPLNLYGACKLAAEKIFVAANNLSGDHGCRFSAVRYGNVVGSRGSIVPFLKQLAAEGKPIPVTNTDCTRFWISLPAAVKFVTTSLAMMQGGEIFVPKLPSMRLMDMIEAFAPGLPYDVVGLRPGEKIHETLLTSDEARLAYDLEDRFVIGKPPLNKLHFSVPDGFSYTSNTNTVWLTPDAIKDLAA